MDYRLWRHKNFSRKIDSVWKDKNIITVIGKKIREIRTEKDLSQEKLATLADLHTTYISQIETGKRNPSVLALVQICHALKIKTADLFATLDI